MALWSVMKWPGFLKASLKPILVRLAGSNAFWRLFKILCVYPVERITAARAEWVTGQLAGRIRREGQMVQAGPFRGMKYPQFRSINSMLIPKLLGTYECELASVIEEYVRRDFPLVIDVGCAEGYYAVGMALRLPKANILAYDTSAEAQALCREMARLNAVEDRVLIRSHCGPDELQQLDFSRGGMIICDCEGYEVDLFNDKLAEHLRPVHLLIELHDGKRPGATEAVKKAFAQTHDIRIIPSLDDHRRVRLYQSPLVSKTDRFERTQAFAEVRSEVMEWAILTPRN